jgi:hypothetical protein
MHGFHSTVVYEYEGFVAGVDQEKIESDTRSWLATAFA